MTPYIIVGIVWTVTIILAFALGRSSTKVKYPVQDFTHSPLASRILSVTIAGIVCLSCTGCLRDLAEIIVAVDPPAETEPVMPPVVVPDPEPDPEPEAPTVDDNAPRTFVAGNYLYVVGRPGWTHEPDIPGEFTGCTVDGVRVHSYGWQNERPLWRSRILSGRVVFRQKGVIIETID